MSRHCQFSLWDRQWGCIHHYRWMTVSAIDFKISQQWWYVLMRNMPEMTLSILFEMNMFDINMFNINMFDTTLDDTALFNSTSFDTTLLDTNWLIQNYGELKWLLDFNNTLKIHEFQIQSLLIIKKHILWFFFFQNRLWVSKLKIWNITKPDLTFSRHLYLLHKHYSSLAKKMEYRKCDKDQVLRQECQTYKFTLKWKL